MKIIATRTDRQYGSTPDTFIVEISLAEIQKVAQKAGYKEWGDDDTRKLLAPGCEYDIAAGYDFRADILNATSAMSEGLKKFGAATNTMQRFVGLIQQQEQSDAHR